MSITPATSLPRRRFAIVGLGARHELYREAILTTYRASAELVALCDSNAGRLAAALSIARASGALPRPYTASEYAALLRDLQPDVVIVTTPDATHHTYAVQALDAGCEVVTEKPMTVDAVQCRQLLDAEGRTGKRCRVTFNYRYSPPRTQVKDLLMSGVIGDVMSVDFHWLLNTHHGADYFRRWHAHKESSGGLFVHKSTHHFDLVNWWLGALPVSVAATGKREFYTPAMARRMGLAGPHVRCCTCPENDRCGFYLDLAASPMLNRLYLQHEGHDGYWRDRCVFRPEIDIEDTLNALVAYDSGATLSYSLNAFNAWEGYTVAFNGTKGRLEHSVIESVYDKGNEVPPNEHAEEAVKTRVIPLRGAGYDVKPWSAPGAHGGGDRLMLADIFSAGPAEDPYLRAADARAGAASVLVGIAGNLSLETGRRISLDEIFGELPRPDFSPMPGRNLPLPMPPRGTAAGEAASISTASVAGD